MNLNLFPKDLLVELDAAGQPYTTSLAVAEFLGKKHKNILRDIEKLVSNIGDLKVSDLDAIAAENHYIPDVVGRLRFEPTSFTDKWNRQQPMYRLYRDGFMMLTGRYTGYKATLCQVRFMAAFNTMEELLSERYASYENTFRTLRPRLAIVAEHPDMPRADLQQLTGHKSPSSITASRKRCRELGLLH